MAIRILFFLICSALLAKQTPRTMATRKVISAKAFSMKRAKALESTPKKKKQRNPKSHWGAPKTRGKS